MRYLTLTLILLAAAMPAVGQTAEEPVTTVVVPVVGSVLGMNNVRWKTDIALVNDLGREAVVAIQLPAAPDAPALIITMASGEVQRFTDIVGQAFGLDEALSPLVITTNSRRSITVRATVYGVDGTLVSASQPVPVNYAASSYPYRTLDGLAFSDDLRTNVGLVNLSEREVEFILGVQRVPGRYIATTRIRVSAMSMMHHSVQTLFPLITKGSDFAIVVETGAADTHVYASVIDNHDNSARFIQPRLGGQ